MSRYLFVVTTILFVFILAACGNNNKNEEALPTLMSTVAAHTATPTSINSTMPTATPSPTTIPAIPPTFTLSPTNTPAPKPSPTPQGFYYNASNGFSLTLPPSWKISHEEAGSMELINASSNLNMIIFIGPTSETGSFEDLLEEMVASLDTPGIFIAEQGETVLGGDIVADSAILANAEVSTDFQFRVIYTEEPPYPILIFLIGEQADINSDRGAVTALFDSMQFFTPTRYDLDPSKTLFEGGGDPLPETLDPALQTSSAASYVGLLFSGLVRLTPQLAIEGDLAESWQISADGMTYTFILRPDLTFADGRPLTAYDVQYSWERAAAPNLNSQTVATYMGDIAGIKDKRDGLAETISGVRIIDDRTLEVTLDAPKPYFLAKLTYPVSYIVDQADIESGNAKWMYDPNASGPYKVKDYHESEAFIFERNENYHTPALIPYVLYQFNLFGSALSLYEAGEIDMVGVGSENLLLINQSDHPLYNQLRSATNLCTSFIQLNNLRAPLDDINVRQALAFATDKETLVDRFSDSVQPVAHTFLPPGMPGFVPTEPEITYDPDLARELLANSSYGNEMPAITIAAFGRGDTENEYMIAIATMWEEVLGIEFEFAYFDPVNYTTAARELESNMILWGWCADYPDPENFLDLLMYSTSDFNLAEYTNPELDSLLEEARTEFDVTKRLALYHQAEQLLLKDMGVIPLNHSISYLLVNPRINGYILSPMGVAQIHLLSITPSQNE